MGDPEPKCSEFIPSALVWLLGPCPWLFPGNIASNYTTRGAQPLRYHAKFQTDLITTTSRKRTQWGRPPPRRVFKQKHETPKQRLSLHQSLNSFPHRKRREQSKSIKNKLSFSLVNSEWMNSPTSPKPFPNKFKLITNSKNVLYWFVVVDKRHAHPGKIKLHHNRPNSLANAAHAASEFRKQRLTFLSINIITKYFALPCKVQKTTKNTSFPDVIPPF